MTLTMMPLTIGLSAIGSLMLSLMKISWARLSVTLMSILVLSWFILGTPFTWVTCFQGVLWSGWMVWRAMSPPLHTHAQTAWSIDILLLFSVTGMLSLLQATTGLEMLISLEMFSIPLYITTALSGNNPRMSSEAALHYFVMGTIGTLMIVWGWSFLQPHSPSLHVSDWLQAFHQKKIHPSCCCATPILEGLGLVFLIAGFFIKLGVFPFHLWLPDIYHKVPLALSVFYSLFPKFAIMGFLYRLYQTPAPWDPSWLEPFFYGVGGLSMLCGGWGAFRQQSLGRLIGYSSLMQSGWVLWCVTQSEGHVTFMALITGYGLSLLGVLLLTPQKARIESLISIDAWTKHLPPSYAPLILVILASWMGLPPLAGFWGKFLILQTFAQHQHMGWMVCGLMSILLSMAYILHVMNALHWTHSEDHISHPRVSWVVRLWPWLLLAWGVVMALLQNRIPSILEG